MGAMDFEIAWWGSARHPNLVKCVGTKRLGKGRVETISGFMLLNIAYIEHRIKGLPDKNR